MRYIAIVLIASLLAACTDNPFVSTPEPEPEVEKSTLEKATDAVKEVFTKKEFEQTEKPSVDLSHVETIFNEYDVVLPNGNRVRVCSAYGCTHQQVYRLSPDLLKQAKSEFASAWTAEGEREGLAKAIALIEQSVGEATETSSDNPGEPLLSNGNYTQMNSVDEALNTTSYLMVLYRYELIRHHDLLGPTRIGGTFNSKMVVLLRDRATGEKYVLDSSVGVNGEPAEIYKLELD